MKKALVIIRTAPYGEASPAEGYRVLIALPALGMDTTGLVMDDGVYCLVKAADPTTVGWKGNVAEAFAQAGEFDARLLVHRPSLASRGVGEGELVAHDGFVDDAGLKALLDDAGVVLAF